MKASIFVATVFSGMAAAASAEDFAGMQFGPTVTVGKLLDCQTLDAVTLKLRAPKAFAWAVSQGLAEESKVTGTASYTAKVTTKGTNGAPTLIVGCWVATEIVTETVNGQEKAYAKGVFKINDAIRSSPLADLAICKKKRSKSEIYIQGSFSVLYGDSPTCKADNWQERIAPLAAAEGRTALFGLREAMDKTGYIREIGW